MKIIGKHKDYFDYLIHRYGVDEKLILNRRGIGEYKIDYNANSEVGYYTGTNVKRNLLSDENAPRSGKRLLDNSSYKSHNTANNELVEWLVVNGRGYPIIMTSAYPLTYVLANDENSCECQSWWDKEPYKAGTPLKEFVDLSKLLRRHTFIVRCRGGSWDINGNIPILNEFKFGSIIDPQTMYLQTVDFISENFVDKGEEILVQSDIEKVVSHGFDKKSSFRHKITKEPK